MFKAAPETYFFFLLLAVGMAWGLFLLGHGGVTRRLRAENRVLQERLRRSEKAEAMLSEKEKAEVIRGDASLLETFLGLMQEGWLMVKADPRTLRIAGSGASLTAADIDRSADASFLVATGLATILENEPLKIVVTATAQNVADDLKLGLVETSKVEKFDI